MMVSATQRNAFSNSEIIFMCITKKGVAHQTYFTGIALLSVCSVTQDKAEFFKAEKWSEVMISGKKTMIPVLSGFSKSREGGGMPITDIQKR